METDETDQALILAHTADCRAEYSRASDAVQLRFGQADLRLTPAQFLSVCATMLKAARALGRQPYIPGLVPERRSGCSKQQGWFSIRKIVR